MTDSGLYSYVEALRAEKGWSQAELARRARRDRQIFVRMRSGGKVSHETIHLLAEALGVPAAELLRRQGYPVEQLGVVSESVEPPPLTRDELLRRARSELSHDELLVMVRERMRDVPDGPDMDPPEPDGDAVLRAHEPVPPIRASRPKPTGGRRTVDAPQEDGAQPVE